MRANTFLEYVIILGVVSAVLIGMNTYVKRGIQGRLKEMTDYFMSNEQVVETSPTVQTTSQANTVYSSGINTQELIGGGLRRVFQDTTDTKATSKSVDRDLPFTQGSSAVGEEGQITPPPYPQIQTQYPVGWSGGE